MLYDIGRHAKDAILANYIEPLVNGDTTIDSGNSNSERPENLLPFGHLVKNQSSRRI
jgi:hypothetical protein